MATTLDTLGDIKAFVANKRRDEDFEHWDEDQTVVDINVAIQWLTDEVPLATAYGTWEQALDATNTAEIVPPLGHDLDEVISLKRGTTNLTPTTPAELAAQDAGWDTRVGEPIRYIPDFRRDSQERQIVRLVPMPAAVPTDVAGEYTRVHPWITTSTDRLLVGIQYRIAVAAWALHLGYAGDSQESQDLSKAQWWERRALDALARARKKTARRFDRSPSTVTLQR